jgi:hypothetical protein
MIIRTIEKQIISKIGTSKVVILFGAHQLVLLCQIKKYFYKLIKIECC